MKTSKVQKYRLGSVVVTKEWLETEFPKVVSVKPPRNITNKKYDHVLKVRYDMDDDPLYAFPLEDLS